MKRWINASKASERYQNSQQAKATSNRKKEHRLNYVRSIRDEVGSKLSNMIKENLFNNHENNTMFEDYFDNYLNKNKKYITHYIEEFLDGDTEHYISELKSDMGAHCYMSPGSDCIRLTVDTYGLGHANHGLSWLADLQTGGDGSFRGATRSQMPARMKRKMSEYQDAIANYIEDLGFEVLGPAKNTADGFEYPVTNDKYETLL